MDCRRATSSAALRRVEGNVILLFLAACSALFAADPNKSLYQATHEASLALREQVLQDTIAKDNAWPSGVWGEVLWSLSALSLNEKVNAANARLLQRAQAYIAHHTSGRDISTFTPEEAVETPWAYFALSDYVRILYLFHAKSAHYPGRLNPETEAAMKEALWHWVKSESTVTGASQDNLLVLLGTENHDLTRRPNHYLISSMLKDDPAFRDRRYDDGHTAAEHATAYTTFFQEWPRQRATTGLWMEIGSNTYQKYSWPALFNLHELAPDPMVRKQFGQLLDLALIEEAQISVRGRRGGGRSRAEGGKNGFESYKNLIYAIDGQPAGGSHSRVIETSRYQAPRAAILLRKQTLPAKAPFVIRNRVLGELAQAPHRYTADSALVNYAYRTPHYLLGSTLQDPSLTTKNPDPNAEKAEWKYGGISRQKRACGMLLDHPDRDTVSEIYPVIEKTRGGRPQHAYWSVQHKNILLLQRIASQTRKRLGSYSTGAISIHFDGEDLEKIEKQGWIFASNGNAFAAVKFLDGPFQWDESGHVASPANFDPLSDTSRILIHAGDITTHSAFAPFQQQVLSFPLEVTRDRVQYTFEHDTPLTATRYDVEHPERYQLPTVNGTPIELRPTTTWQSPYLNGKFGEGQIFVTVGPIQEVLDFGK